MKQESKVLASNKPLKLTSLCRSVKRRLIARVSTKFASCERIQVSLPLHVLLLAAVSSRVVAFVEFV